MDFQKVTVSIDDTGIRLDRWFKRNYANVPFAQIAKMIRKKLIRVNAKSSDISTRVETDDVISFPEFTHSVGDDPKPATKHIDASYKKLILDALIYKDDKILVLNKPAGLAVQGGTKVSISVDDLSEYLKFEYEEKPKLVHRIDKETSGILILARKANVASQLAALFKARKIEKHYLALTYGVPKERSGKIVSKIAKVKTGNFERMVQSEDGKTAITYYRVIDSAPKEYAILELNIVTGKTHQIRAQLAEMETPIVGDDKYSTRAPLIDILDKKLYLHASTVRFVLDEKEYAFEAELPPYFEDALNTLALSAK